MATKVFGAIDADGAPAGPHLAGDGEGRVAETATYIQDMIARSVGAFAEG